MYKKTKNLVRKVKYFPRKSLKNRLAAHRTQNCQKNRENHDILQPPVFQLLTPYAVPMFHSRPCKMPHITP